MKDDGDEMNNTLELKLAEYGTKNPIRCDRELITALGAIIESERKKPGCDYDLIDEALIFLCELSGKNSEPSEKAQRLPASAREETDCGTSGARVRWILIAAALFVLLAAAAAGVMRGDEPDMPDELKEEIMSMGPGDVLETDNWEIAVGYDAGDVETFDDLVNALSGSGILLPYTDGYDVTVTRFESYRDYRIIGLELAGENGRSEVEIRTEDAFEEKPETYRIGRFDVALFTYDDPAMTGDVIHQGSFVYGGATYNVWAASEGDLERIITSFEEIKR